MTYCHSASNTFQEIKSWKDVQTYAGQIVAISNETPLYYTQANIIKPAESNAFLFSRIQCTFAYISNQTNFHQNKIGHTLNMLYRADGFRSSIHLDEEALNQYGSIFIRLASKEELSMIRKVLDTNQASFSSTRDPDGELKVKELFRKTLG